MQGLMTHILTRRSVTTGLAAAVTAIPAVGLCKGASLPNGSERVRLALKELEAAVAAYYPDATKLQAVFNKATPDDLAGGRTVAVCMVLADRLDDPKLSRSAHNPTGINDGYRGFQISKARQS
jgi:hypothetical protein